MEFVLVVVFVLDMNSFVFVMDKFKDLVKFCDDGVIIEEEFFEMKWKLIDEMWWFVFVY